MSDLFGNHNVGFPTRRLKCEVKTHMYEKVFGGMTDNVCQLLYEAIRKISYSLSHYATLILATASPTLQKGDFLFAEANLIANGNLFL